MSDAFNPPNSVWPNGLKVDSEGYVIFYPLGTNKVDITTITWPDGDELVSPFVYKNDKLVAFVDTQALTITNNTLIYLPYTHIEAEFSAIDKGQLQIHAPKATTKKASWKDSGKEDIPEAQFKYKGCTTVDDVKAVDANYKTTDIVDGVWSEPLWDLTNGSEMFAYCENLSEFESDLSSLTSGSQMFVGCSNLTSFSSDLASLANGHLMFQSCSNLTSFFSDLSSLTNGAAMFSDCSNLTSFNGDLSSLTNGENMFRDCFALNSFTSDLSSLTDGYNMFSRSNLTSFTSDLSSLTSGHAMFYGCINLTSFSSDLSSLTVGSQMFDGCKLDAPSVQHIIGTINRYRGSISLGMGCNNTEADKNFFAQEAGYADMISLFVALEAKGWTLNAQYNGRPTTTYGLRRPSEDTLPVFVKLEELEEETYADYTSEDGSKKFRLNWFHETSGSTEGYTQYATLEEAIEAFNIKPIERN